LLCRKNGAAMKSSAPGAGPYQIKQSPLFAVFAFRFFSEPHNLIYNLQQIIISTIQKEEKIQLLLQWKQLPDIIQLLRISQEKTTIMPAPTALKEPQTAVEAPLAMPTDNGQ
jgi:hypothetical protein